MMFSNLNVCLCPLEIKWNAKEDNLKSLSKIVRLIHPNTDLLILPETFSTGFPSMKDKDTVREMAERNTGETIDLLKQLAAERNIAIAGSFIADTGGNLYNRLFFIEPTGDEYFEDKRHLFTMAKEDEVFSKGDTRLCIRFRGWNIAIVACYDIRFPVWCRNVRNEYDVLIAVANWPKVRVGAWNTLLPARAIENQAYVCGVNCKGTDDLNIEYDGSSAVIDFKGKSIGIHDSLSDVIYAQLSREKLNSFREKFPAWNDADRFSIL